MKTSVFVLKKSVFYTFVMFLALVMILSMAPAALAAGESGKYVVDGTNYNNVDDAVTVALGGDKVLELNGSGKYCRSGK